MRLLPPTLARRSIRCTWQRSTLRKVAIQPIRSKRSRRVSTRRVPYALNDLPPELVRLFPLQISRSASGFKGVHQTPVGHWQTQHHMSLDGSSRLVHCGTFLDPATAALAHAVSVALKLKGKSVARLLIERVAISQSRVCVAPVIRKFELTS